MSTRAEWLQAQIAPTKQALDAGDGCHADEAKSLANYLDGKWTAQESATAFTTPILEDDDPTTALSRPMGLLCEVLVELVDDRDRLLALLAAIQELPPTAQINWSDLPGFGNMWSDLYRLYTHGAEAWEKSDLPLSGTRTTELRRHFEATGATEAELYLRGLGGVTAHWGYETLSLISKERVGVEVFISSMHAWLKKAGMKLKQDLNRNEIRIDGGELPMADYWESWKNAFLKASGEDGFSSTEARQLAAECHELMK
ncbi:hypothetical protein QQS21_000461 [Conoideocrella luteorostrata]|uniref:Uncharacterized protein n=1 Tax=Conoideocrella luteorostrata TaxID=1105319 RepID=A0AAJ0CZ51_9HYPO|nr:hypothetical protein QQS21_000461 [Conoideocrella luteorostrata]